MRLVYLWLWSLTLATGCAPLTQTKKENATLASPAGTVAPGAADLAVNEKATKLLAEKCASCHNSTKASGGFGFIEDTDALIASGKYVIPGKPEESLIYLKTDPSNAKSMPPTAPLTDEERTLIRDWIVSLADPTGTEKAALTILKDKCASCHDGASASGGFGYVTDTQKMIASGRYIILDNPEESLIYKRTDPKDGAPMPPKVPLTDNERATILAWIKLLQMKTSNYWLSDADFLKLLAADLETKVAPGARAGTRYFTLHHLKMAQVSEQRIEAARQALVKVLNSVSLSNNIARPVAIDKEKLIYRINLFDINMPLTVFETAYAFARSIAASRPSLQTI